MTPDAHGIPTAGSAPPARTTAYGADPAQVYDVRLPTTADPSAPGPSLTGVTVVVVHGGFWREGYDRAHAAPQAQGFADRGAHVAVVEYRRTGMPGGGWPGTFEDVTAAVAAVRADPELPKTVVLVGHSAGGHLVTLAASQPWADGLRGVVSLAGVVDLVRADELGLGGGAVRAFLGSAPAQAPGDPLAAADPALLSPLVPVVLVHGTADDVVPLEVSQSYLARVSGSLAAPDRVRTVEVPGAGHFELIDPADPAYLTVVEAVSSLTREPTP